MSGVIKQRDEYDCGICCIAMATARDYDEVLSKVGDLYNPCAGISQEAKALGLLGCNWTGLASADIIGISLSANLSPKRFRLTAWGRRAIMLVPSLNKPGSSHFIYWDGRQIFDPSNKLTYRDFSELEPTRLNLFGEAPPRLPTTPIEEA